MLHIHRPQTDPYFNLAAEEYLLKTLEEDAFMLWVNEPAVILGKHQNAFAEIDTKFVKENKIPVIRRISGGGTVFHDPGNLNFSFISRGEKEKLVDFRRFTRPIIDYLESLGLPARFEGKNDIRIHGLKVSGNAEHVYRDKVLHHGTLLYSAGLDELNRAIRGQESLFLDKAVKSVRSRVANISDLLEQAPTLEEFRNGIITHMRSRERNLTDAALSSSDVIAIRDLAHEKYRSWKWNYGYSPKFMFEKTIRYQDEDIPVKIEVVQGIISDATTLPSAGDRIDLSGFKGLPFDEDAMLANYGKVPFSKKFSPVEYRELLTALMY